MHVGGFCPSESGLGLLAAVEAAQLVVCVDVTQYVWM